MGWVFVEEDQGSLGAESTVESVAESDLACSLDPVKKEVGSKEVVSSLEERVRGWEISHGLRTSLLMLEQ